MTNLFLLKRLQKYISKSYFIFLKKYSMALLFLILSSLGDFMHAIFSHIRLFLLFLVLISCEKKRVDPYPFENGKRSKLVMNYPKDARGYYLVPLDTTRNSNRFSIYIEASKLIPFYHYNGVSIIQARFDSDSYWVLGTISGNLAVTIPLYNPFTSLYSSPYFSVPLPADTTTIILSQYRNSIVSIVQDAGIYLKEYFAGSMYQPADEYQPETGMYWGKRIIGPIPKYFLGDTIKVYSRVFWDAGNYTYTKPNETTKIDSVKIIFR